MPFLDRLAAGLTGLSAMALVMTEMHWTSIWGAWQPTHLSSISFGVIAIAVSNVSGSIKSDQARDRSGSMT